MKKSLLAIIIAIMLFCMIACESNNNGFDMDTTEYNLKNYIKPYWEGDMPP